MLKLNIDNIGDLAIVECEGRIVQSERLLNYATLSPHKAKPALLWLNCRKCTR